MAQNIRLYRISSGIIPLASHPKARWPWRRILARELQEIGRLVRAKRLRVSMHPGQYTVLNSPHKSIVDAARAELLYHANFLDRLRLDATHKIVLHVGGLYGDQNASLRRFHRRFQALPANVQSRLVLENDERNYGAEDALALSDALGIPMVFDYLHHTAYSSELPTEKLLARVYEGWSRSDGPPELHYSTQRTGSRAGSHADTINTKDFLEFLQLLPPVNVDIMLEAKSKDLALQSLRRKLLAHRRILDEWAIM